MTTPRGRGNQNAAKPAGQRRVTLSLRVLPETRARLALAAVIFGSLSRAVDALTTDLTDGGTPGIRVRDKKI